MVRLFNCEMFFADEELQVLESELQHVPCCHIQIQPGNKVKAGKALRDHGGYECLNKALILGWGVGIGEGVGTLRFLMMLGGLKATLPQMFAWCKAKWDGDVFGFW